MRTPASERMGGECEFGYVEKALDSGSSDRGLMPTSASRLEKLFSITKLFLPRTERDRS